MSENTGLEPTTDKSDPPTMKEIARLAGVSIGTVDRVLHHRGRVSPENVVKINSIISEQGYRPNVFASRLSGGAGTRTIGVVIPEADQDFGYWSLIGKGLQRAAQELEPLHIGVKVVEFDRNSPEACAEALKALQPDSQALALAPIHSLVLRPLVEALDPELPLVFFDTDMHCSHAHCFVGQEARQGGILAAKLLGLTLKSGAPVVLVRFDEDDEHLQLRSEGFESFMKEEGHPVIRLEQRFSQPLEQRRAELAACWSHNPGAQGLFVPNASVGQYASPGKRVVGYDLIPGNVAAMRDGHIDFLLSQRPEIMGYETVRRLSRTLLFREPLPDRVALPLDVVLKENLEGQLGPSSELQLANTVRRA